MEEPKSTIEPVVKKRRGRKILSDEHKRKTRAGINARYYEKIKKARELMKSIEANMNVEPTIK